MLGSLRWLDIGGKHAGQAGLMRFVPGIGFYRILHRAFADRGQHQPDLDHQKHGVKRDEARQRDQKIGDRQAACHPAREILARETARRNLRVN